MGQSQTKASDPIGSFFQGLVPSTPNDNPKELPILPISGSNSSPIPSIFPTLTPPKTNIPIIDEVTKTVTNPVQVISNASTAPSDIFNNLNNVSSSLGLANLSNQLSSTTGSITNIGSQLASTTGSINNIGSQLSSTAGNLTNLVNQSTQSTLGGITTLSGQLTNITGDLSKQITSSTGTITSGFNNLGTQLTNTTGAITNLGASQAQGFGNISNLIGQTQTGLFSGLNQLQTNIGSSISGLNQNIGSAIQTTGNITAQGFGTLNTGISAISQGQLETIRALSDASRQTQSNIAGLTNTVNSNFQYIVILGALGAGVFVLSQNRNN